MQPDISPRITEKKVFYQITKKGSLLLVLNRCHPHQKIPARRLLMDGYDDSRLHEFRQLKDHIRGSKDYLVVGIDMAKDRHNAFFGIPTGRSLLRRLAFDNTRDGFEKLLFHADMIMRQNTLKKTVYGMEPTADYHKPLGEYLISRGHTVVLVAGAAVRNNRELLDGRWDKNDTKDAANIADLVCQGKCLFYDHPSPLIREIRSLLSLKRKLKKQEHSYAVRIRNHLVAQYFPELDPYFSYSEGPAIVRWCLDPRELHALSFEEFSRMVLSRNGGGRQRERLREIQRKAASSIGCAVLPSVSYEAGILVNALRQVREMIGQTDGKIALVCKEIPGYANLLSIPGFGPDISAKVIGALGDPNRFDNHRQVLKLAGLDLSGDRSGKRNDVPVVISKKGKADLRYGLYQAALVASTKDRSFIRYFTDRMTGREREKGIGKKIRVKMAAKMLVIAWTLMKKKEMFRAEHII